MNASAGGYIRGGLDKIATPADGMFGEQLGRYKRLLETGSPAPR